MKAIKNARIIHESGILENHILLFNEKIIEIIPFDLNQTYELDEMIDAGHHYVSPGFIDIHIHGSGGSDTADATGYALQTVSTKLASTGVTAFLATTITEDIGKIKAALRNASDCRNKVTGAKILGCHLEGPFLNSQFKGAHNPDKMILPDISLIKEFKDIVRLVTFAPEISGSREFIQYCKGAGIALSIGHSAASYEQALDAISQGVGHITHTFNGMSPLHHRKPGVVGAAMNTTVSCELIVDNVHLHTAIPEIMYKLKGIDKIVLVTDAMRACGMPEGNYDLGGRQVSVKDGKAVLADGSLAGSVLTMNTALKNFREITKLPLEEVIKAATVNPAKVISAKKKGLIKPGMDADFTIFDADFNIISTIVNGKCVYQKF